MTQRRDKVFRRVLKWKIAIAVLFIIRNVMTGVLPE